jgi:hypothetical protein
MDMERIPCRQHFVGGKVVEGRVVGFGGLRFFLLKMIDGCFGGKYGNIPCKDDQRVERSERAKVASMVCSKKVKCEDVTCTFVPTTSQFNFSI